MNEFEYIASLEAEKKRLAQMNQRIANEMAKIPLSDLERDWASKQMKKNEDLCDILAVRIALAKERMSKDAWDTMQPVIEARGEVL